MRQLHSLLAVAGALFAVRGGWANTTSIAGNDNIVVSGNSGPVSIRVGNSTTQSSYSYTYNNTFGLSEEEVSKLVTAVAKKDRDRSQSFFNSLSVRLDKLARQLLPHISLIESKQTQLAEQQVLLAKQHAVLDEHEAETQALVKQLGTELAQREQARKDAADAAIDSIAQATAEAVVQRMIEQQAKAEAAARDRRRAIAGEFTLGGNFGASAEGKHYLVDLDLRGTLVAMSSEWALEAGGRVFSGSREISTRFEDGAGRALGDPRIARHFTYGLQAELGVRANRSSVWTFPALVGWQRWYQATGDTSPNVGHWAAVGEVGAEYRDGLVLGLSFVAKLDLKSTQSVFQYTGVGASTRAIEQGPECSIGGRLYAGFSF
jgi:hypothetical protein